MIQQGSYAIPREDLGEAFHEYDSSVDGFIADQILPVREVRKKAATLSVVTRENLKRADDRHANGATFNRVNLAVEDKEYLCVDRGLEGPLSDEDRENYENDFDAELETVADIRHKIYVEREIRAAELVFNTTTWTGADLYTDNSGSPWDNVGTNIIAQVAAAKEKTRRLTGVYPDSMVIGAATLNNVQMNTGIIARFPGASIVTEAMILANLAALFGLQNLFVGKKTYDSAAEGQDFAAADIWADDYAMVFRRQTNSTRSPGLGRHVVWSNMAAGKPTVIQYREEQTESDIFRDRLFEEAKIWDAFFGHLMKID